MESPSHKRPKLVPAEGQQSAVARSALTRDELLAELLQRVDTNSDRAAEIIILELMREHRFDFLHLKEILKDVYIAYPDKPSHKEPNHHLFLEQKLSVSFSRVKYSDIAPRVGLNPIDAGRDIPSFLMRRARLPNSVFHKIIEDVRIFAKQYGRMAEHGNEEGRARYLSSVCKNPPRSWWFFFSFPFPCFLFFFSSPLPG
jgi:hypothetical protein